MTNGKLKRIVDKYHDNGFDAVIDDVQELNAGSLIYRQIRYTYDLCENALRTLDSMRSKIECRGGPKINSMIAFEDQIEAYEPLASQISLKLWKAINEAYDTLEKGVIESNKEFRTFIDELQEKYM